LLKVTSQVSRACVSELHPKAGTIHALNGTTQMSFARVRMMCRMCMCRLPTGDGTGAAAPCGRDKER